MLVHCCTALLAHWSCVRYFLSATPSVSHLELFHELPRPPSSIPSGSCLCPLPVALTGVCEDGDLCKSGQTMSIARLPVSTSPVPCVCRSSSFLLPNLVWRTFVRPGGLHDGEMRRKHRPQTRLHAGMVAPAAVAARPVRARGARGAPIMTKTVAAKAAARTLHPTPVLPLLCVVRHTITTTWTNSATEGNLRVPDAPSRITSSLPPRPLPPLPLLSPPPRPPVHPSTSSSRKGWREVARPNTLCPRPSKRVVPGP